MMGIVKARYNGLQATDAGSLVASPNTAAQIIQSGQMGPFGQRRTPVARMVLSGWASGMNGTWSADQLEQVRHWKHHVYIAGRCIANKIAEEPPRAARLWEKRAMPEGKRFNKRLHAERKRYLRAMGRSPDCWYWSNGASSQERPFLSSGAKRKALASDVQEHEELEPLGRDHPLVDLLNRPNQHDTAWNFYWAMYMYLHLTGAAIIWLVPGKDGRNDDGTLKKNFRPVEMWIIPTHWMWPRSFGQRNIDWWEMRPFEVGYATGPIRFEPEEIIYIPDPNPVSKLSPYSPLAACAEMVDTFESIEQSRFWSFKNGPFPSFAVELGEQYLDPDQPTLDRYQARFAERLSGEQNVDKPIVLPPGAKVTPLAITPREMMYKESGDSVRDQVYSIWGLNKTIVGVSEDVNFATAEAAWKNHYDVTINPVYSKVGQALSFHLAPRFGDDLRVYWPDRAPQDPAQLTVDLQADAAAGAITINEWRAIRGREPYPHGGDDPMVNIGMAPQPWVTGDTLEEMPLVLPSGTSMREGGEIIPASADEAKLGSEAESLEQTGVEPKVPKETPGNLPQLQHEPAEVPTLNLPKKRLLWAGAGNGKLLTKGHVLDSWKKLLEDELDGDE